MKLKFFSPSHRDHFEALVERIKAYYDSSLLSLVIYGSYARGENRLDSDLDLLIVLDPLPKRSRLQRQEDFIRNIELVDDVLMEVSPFILGRKEASSFSPLYLDMVSDHVLLVDREDFLKNLLKEFSEKMKRWGSRRVPVGGHWYWEIKPGLKWNEVIDYDQ